MGPRQLIRLKEARKADSFDDQKTPAQIATAETVSTTHEDLQEYVLSQIRQILGTANWHDGVPVNLTDVLSSLDNRFMFTANCLATDEVGDCVYPNADAVAGVYQVTKVDPTDENKMPAVGIIRDKSGPTDCRVQFAGIMSGIYGGLDTRKPLFIDYDGGLTQTLPTLGAGESYFAQVMGRALDDSVLLIEPGVLLVRYKG